MGIISETIEVCISEDLRISCLSNQVIFVTSAIFGRMEVGRCIKKNDEFLGCANDVLPLLDRWCSGRQECMFEVTNDHLEAANKDCLEILMKYLKVEYTCFNGKYDVSSRSSILDYKIKITHETQKTYLRCGHLLSRNNYPQSFTWEHDEITGA